MNSSLLKQILESYKIWVSKHPAMVTDIENTFTWSTYFITDKLSPIMSEAVYSLTKLISLFNDEAIRAACTGDGKLFDTEKKVKLTLTVIYYSRALYELLLNQALGVKAKWIGIVILSLFKAMLRLILLGKYGLTPIASPPIPPLNRVQFQKQETQDKPRYIKTHTGRVIHSTHDAPDFTTKDWQPLQVPNTPHRYLTTIKMYAELIYTIRPVAHLCCLWVSNKESWVPWLISLGLDIISLKLFGISHVLKKDERHIIMGRYADLLLYLFRNPMYDKYTKSVTTIFFVLLSKTAPCLKNMICEQILHWQHIHLYMWS